MSTKSTHSLLIVPNEAVSFYSETLESQYEQLHRLLCKSQKIPFSLKSISLMCELMRVSYYAIREELEADAGISEQVAMDLPTPDVTDTLKTLVSWEGSDEGYHAYLARLNGGDSDKFEHYSAFWKQFRFMIFEAQRTLRITRSRIASNTPLREPRRYLWLTEENVTFESDD
ncbi:MAG: hypothetical protein ACI9VT_003143 [Psychroserpens sp.]